MTRRLTLRAVQEAIDQVERGWGTLAARCFAQRLSYEELTRLARRGLAEGDSDDHPDRLDPRFLLVWGMTGERVAMLQYALRTLGFDIEQTGRFDDQTARVYAIWRREQTKFEPSWPGAAR